MVRELSQYRRLAELGGKVLHETASGAERDEFIELTYAIDQLDRKYFDDYKSGKDTSFVLKMALAGSSAFLLMCIIEDIYEKISPGKTAA